MQMTDGEVVLNIMQAKDQKAQISICADLNCCSEEKIKEILKAQGVDLRSLKGAVKKNINHGIEHKTHKKLANAEKITVAQACATLIARVAELAKQKKAIEKELEEIEAQIGRVSDDIGEALLSLPEVSE
jgi:seryl-tRNA synthetase